MLIIPAIDIQDNRVVRLTQGAFDKKKIYSADPAKTARHWAKQGARLIHVVDLDGASSGKPKNIQAVKDILKAVDIPIEFGGGVRDMETIKTLCALGVSRVVLGTRAVEDVSFLKKAFKTFKEKIIVSVDTRGEDILIKGWQKEACQKISLDVFLKTLKSIGLGEFIFTDVRKDGMLAGPNLKEAKRVLKVSGIKLIASGGISSLADIKKLKLLEKDGLSGVIIGKALYEGRFTLQQALKLA